MKQTRIGPSIEINGAAVRELRIFSRHLGVAALAREAQVTPQYICMIESGRRGRVSPQVFGRLKAALHVTDCGALIARPDVLVSEPVPA
jgi:hypothetical protein